MFVFWKKLRLYRLFRDLLTFSNVMTTICSPLVEIGLTYQPKFEGAIASVPLVPAALIYIHLNLYSFRLLPAYIALLLILVM